MKDRQEIINGKWTIYNTIENLMEIAPANLVKCVYVGEKNINKEPLKIILEFVD